MGKMKERPYPLPAARLRRYKLRGHKLRRIQVDGGLRRSLYLRRQVTDWASHLRGVSNDTLITVLGTLPSAPDS